MADITNAGGLTDKDYLSDFLHAQKQVAAD